MNPHNNRVPHHPENFNDYPLWALLYGFYAPYGQCQCGCGQDALLAECTNHELGYIEGHPTRFSAGHDNSPLYLSRGDEVRFWEKVNKAGQNDCWIWTGAKSNKGYGTFFLNKRWLTAHRAAWLFIIGQIPGSLEVCHDCPGGDNPSCVNPHHMFLGTHLQNMQDLVHKHRQDCRPHSTNPRHGQKLLASDVPLIRQLHAQGITYAELGRRYSITGANIKKLCIRANWAWVP